MEFSFCPQAGAVSLEARSPLQTDRLKAQPRPSKKSDIDGRTFHHNRAGLWDSAVNKAAEIFPCSRRKFFW